MLCAWRISNVKLERELLSRSNLLCSIEVHVAGKVVQVAHEAIFWAAHEGQVAKFLDEGPSVAGQAALFPSGSTRFLW
jgi:hypothetical protein